MNPLNTDVSRLLEVICNHLDVPKSLYEKAANRHRSLGELVAPGRLKSC